MREKGRKTKFSERKATNTDQGTGKSSYSEGGGCNMV
jgi:hypothetical protein